MSFCSLHISAEWRRGIRVSLAILATILPVAAQLPPFTTQDIWQWHEILDPRIAPDASQVAYLLRTPQRDSNSYETRLWLAAAAGSAPQPFSPPGSFDSCPRWSPDSARLAWISVRDGRDFLIVRRVSGGAEISISSPGAEYLAWSSVHGLAMLVLDGPLHRLTTNERRTISHRLLEMVEKGL